MNLNLFFTPTDILLPAHADMRRWSVIACDQFTADAGYWQAVQDTVCDAPSTLRLMLPEFYLGKCDEAAATREIQQTMRRYLDDGVFRTVPHSLVLVQRTLPGGAVRCGVVGALDLEAYDYAPDSVTPIRATEGTVASRLPARVRIRAVAALETYFLENKVFYCNALAYNGQNSLQQYMFDYLRSIFEQNVRELSPDASAEDTRKIGQFLAGAMMGILIPWVLSGMKSNALSNMSELSIPVFNHEIMQKLLRGDPQ